jgi:hypothetical protein
VRQRDGRDAGLSPKLCLQLEQPESARTSASQFCLQSKILESRSRLATAATHVCHSPKISLSMTKQIIIIF